MGAAIVVVVAVVATPSTNHPDTDYWKQSLLTTTSTTTMVVPMMLRRLLCRPLTSAWPRWFGLSQPKDTRQTAGANKNKNNDSADDTPLIHKANPSSSSSSKTHDNKKTSFALFSSSSLSSWMQTLADGGPLGPGSAKLVCTVVGMAVHGLWQLWDTPDTTTFGHSSLNYCCTWGSPFQTLQQHGWWLPVTVAILAVTVNGVLWAWSTLTQSRGNHGGVNRLVANTQQGRSLTMREQLTLAVWATINAACEEVAFRGLLRREMAMLLLLVSYPPQQQSASWQTFQPFNNNDILTNLAQALVFGMAHYYGIPNGWTGVALTTVYGALMGALADVGQGLAYPIVAHAVADYFIFTSIARRKL